MNHIYRLVWNNAVRAWQPVSEFAAQARGRASAGLCAPMRWPRHALAVALALGLSIQSMGGTALTLQAAMRRWTIAARSAPARSARTC